MDNQIVAKCLWCGSEIEISAKPQDISLTDFLNNGRTLYQVYCRCCKASGPLESLYGDFFDNQKRVLLKYKSINSPKKEMKGFVVNITKTVFHFPENLSLQTFKVESDGDVPFRRKYLLENNAEVELARALVKIINETTAEHHLYYEEKGEIYG